LANAVEGVAKENELLFAVNGVLVDGFVETEETKELLLVLE
jgi:hypothetical protein